MSGSVDGLMVDSESTSGHESRRPSPVNHPPIHRSRSERPRTTLPPHPPTTTPREAHTMDAELRGRADEALQRIVTLRDSL